ncbi:MAG: GNAT family N-acetyltransferase [Streptosporangiales bacterium]|nr:GNAT family N-acetyltransferase [Streptosporangiales bacterium]
MDDLTTARLVLHPMSAEEARRVIERRPARAAPAAPGYPSDGDVEGAGHLLKVWAEAGDPRPFGSYEVRRRSDGLAIGGIGFHGPPDDDGVVVVGYEFVPGVRGNGYASEALRALIALARERGVAAVVGDTARDNLPSQRVMTAAGMCLVSEDAKLRYYRIDLDIGRSGP